MFLVWDSGSLGSRMFPLCFHLFILQFVLHITLAAFETNAWIWEAGTTATWKFLPNEEICDSQGWCNIVRRSKLGLYNGLDVWLGWGEARNTHRLLEEKSREGLLVEGLGEWWVQFKMAERKIELADGIWAELDQDSVYFRLSSWLRVLSISLRNNGKLRIRLTVNSHCWSIRCGTSLCGSKESKQEAVLHVDLKFFVFLPNRFVRGFMQDSR
jgi:hypothetical protein